MNGFLIGRLIRVSVHDWRPLRYTDQNDELSRVASVQKNAVSVDEHLDGHALSYRFMLEMLPKIPRIFDIPSIISFE
jgi:hypothetical protein